MIRRYVGSRVLVRSSAVSKSVASVRVVASFATMRRGVCRKPLPLFIISVVVVITSWWKRYLFVVPSLLHPFLPIQGVPESWHSYFPSLHEWAIVSGTLAMALLIITLYVRFLPVIPINRTAKELGLQGHDESDQL